MTILSVIKSHCLIGVSSSHCQVYKRGTWKLKHNICFYGEADLKLQAWYVTGLFIFKSGLILADRSEKFAIPERPALLITIDSDAIAIAMCNNAPVSVELARTWRDSAGQQYFSSGKSSCTSVSELQLTLSSRCQKGQGWRCTR